MPGAIDSAIWGDRFDAWTTLWLIEHLGERVATGNWNPVTTDILHPLGYNLWSFGHMGLQLIGGVMVALGIPLIVSYNLLLVAGIWTAALAAHWFGWVLTRSHRAAAIAGIVFSTSPYLYAEAGAGCIELVAAGLLPLYAASVVRLIQQPGISRFVQSTACLAIIGPFNWYYTLFAGMLTVGIVLWQACRLIRTPRVYRDHQPLRWIALSVLCAATLNAPLITEAKRETPSRPSISAELFSSDEAFDEVRSIANGSRPIETLDEAMLKRVDAMQVHFNSTSIQSLVRADFEFNPLNSTPGRLAYAIGILGLVVAGRRTMGWFAIAVGATTLSLGPFLNVSGSLLLEEAATGWPLPYFWAHEYIPFFSKAYRPYRIGVVALTALSAVGAIGGAALFRSSRTLPVASGILLLGVVGYSQPHWSGDRPAQRPLADATISGFYDDLRDRPPGAVIEVPLHYQPVSNANARTQYVQTVHGHPILNTNQLIRWPDLLRFQEYVTSNSALHSLVNLGRTHPPYAVTGEDLRALQDDGYRWIVAHKRVPADTVELTGESGHADLLGPDAWFMMRSIFGEPVVDNGESVLFDLTASSFEDVVIDASLHRPLDLPFDPITTGFPLVLMPDQAVHIYTGPAQSFHAWIRPDGTDDSVSLRIEDQGIVREHALPLHPESWQYIAVDLQSQGDATLHLVGRSGVPSTVTLTAASVKP